MLPHANLICISTLDQFQLHHPRVCHRGKAEQRERKAAECLFSNHCTLILALTSLSFPAPDLFRTFLSCSLMSDQIINTTNPFLETFSLCKEIRFKLTTPAQHLFIYYHFYCPFMNDLGSNFGMTNGRTTWKVNGQQTSVTKERLHQFKISDLKQRDFFFNSLH